MSRSQRHRNTTELVEHNTVLLASVGRDMAEGYLEVEITGMTMRRLACAYKVILRGAWAHTRDGVRSLVRTTPVH